MTLSLLSLFNTFSPKEWGSRLVAQDLPYGPAARHRLDIYAPRKPKGPLPVVFFIYGGSWMDGDRHNYGFAGRALAALGYVTVIADYRLVPEVEYPGFLDDCAAAFAWMVDNIGRYGGDAERVALMGHSAGAYNAVMLTLDRRYLQRLDLLDRVRCLVGLSGPYDFLPFDGPISLRTFGAVAQPASTQPVTHVTPSAPPMLLGHGGQDRLVLPRNSAELARRLRRAGAVADEIVYPRLGHAEPLLALSRLARGLAPVLGDVAGFFRRHL